MKLTFERAGPYKVCAQVTESNKPVGRHGVGVRAPMLGLSRYHICVQPALLSELAIGQVGCLKGL